MHLFYTPDITPENYTLSEDESKHCVRVLRLKTGDTIYLIDGRGGWHEAKIKDDNPKRCAVMLVNSRFEVGKRNWHLHVAIAPTKNMERLEWFVEKATEMGIDEISLVITDNSERAIVKTDRLLKVAVSAMKQSMKAYLPKINEVIKYTEFIEKHKNVAAEKYIAHCINSDVKPHIKMVYHQEKDVIILIGPEGDFTLQEVKLAIDNTFAEINLGESRLRTETAAVYACAAINILNEK
jgi:16S rRNA (uracil1498-N3)-methyltransferase